MGLRAVHSFSIDALLSLHFCFTIKSMKTRCVMIDCRAQAATIVGVCKYCKGKFCLIHRLPESHQCPCMQSCRDEHLQRLTDQLNKDAVKHAKM